MNKIEQNINLIDRYLLDQLSHEELNVFNQMLKDDTEFEKLFFEMDQLVAGIRFSSQTSSLEETLERLEQSLPLIKPATGDEKKFINPFNNLIEKLYQYMDDLSLKLALSITQVKLALSGVAATILILLGLLINFQRTLSPAVLYLSYFKSPVFENFGTTREAGDITTDPVKVKFNEAMLKYKHKDYQASLDIINSIPVEKLDPERKLYKALVNMNLDNYGIAKNILNDLSNSPDGVWKNQAHWYLGLCLVRENKYADAEALLVKVRDFGGEHSKEAGKLLKKLK